MPVIEQVVAKQMEGMEAAIRAKYEAMQQDLGGVRESTEHAFATTVQSSIPNLAQVRSDPAWAQYLAAKVPLTGQSVGDLITAAYGRRDIESLREIVNGFSSPAPATNYTPAPRPPVSVPTASPWNNAAPQHQAPAQMLPLSGHTRASQDFIKGRITRAQFDQVDSAYEAARATNSIDFDR